MQIRTCIATLWIFGSMACCAASMFATPRAFGRGIPNHPFTDVETEIFNHTLSKGSTIGMINHFWSTACGGRSIDWEKESGIAIYRYYIDGEISPSLEFTPKIAAGIGFPPVIAYHGGSGGDMD